MAAAGKSVRYNVYKNGTDCESPVNTETETRENRYFNSLTKN